MRWKLLAVGMTLSLFVGQTESFANKAGTAYRPIELEDSARSLAGPDQLGSPLLEGEEVWEEGRPFDSSQRAEVIPGSTTLADAVQRLGTPLAKRYINGEPSLLWEHKIIEYSWAGFGGDFDRQLLKRNVANFSRAVAPLISVNATDRRSRETEANQLDIENVLDALRHRLLVQREVTVERLEVFLTKAAGDSTVVARWDYSSKDGGRQISETSEWYFVNGEDWHKEHKKRKKIEARKSRKEPPPPQFEVEEADPFGEE